MNNPRIQMLVAAHKPDKMYQDDVYTPIQVGKALAKTDLNVLGDNTGDHISEKNPTYCELTALYWAWKNLKDIDYIGLCHYRRYFDFHRQVPSYIQNAFLPVSRMDTLDFSIPPAVRKALEQGCTIVPKRLVERNRLFTQYCIHHISDDLRNLMKVIEEDADSRYVRSFRKIMSGNKYSPYNMFIMSWENFDRYCSWLFHVLGKMEKRTDTSHYNPVQKRIYGYMAERLLNVYIDANQLPTKAYPVMTLLNDAQVPPTESWLAHVLKTSVKNVSSALNLRPTEMQKRSV